MIRRFDKSFPDILIGFNDNVSLSLSTDL